MVAKKQDKRHKKSGTKQSTPQKSLMATVVDRVKSMEGWSDYKVLTDVPNVEKMSEVIPKFAEPLIDAAGDNDEAYKKAVAMATMGLALAKTCTAPLLEYGKQGMEDCKNDTNSAAIEAIALDIVVSTGYVSNLTNQPEYYYNSSIAHAFYNGSCSIARDGHHLHGEVVSFGVLVLYAYAKDEENLMKMAKFNKSIGLPVTLADVDLDESHLEALTEAATKTNEWKNAPFPFTKEEFITAIKKADAVGQSL